MKTLSIYDELDQAIEQMLGAPETAGVAQEESVRELVELASDLRELPQDNFKSRLQLELEWAAAGRAVTADTDQQKQAPRRSNTQVLPSLFGKSWSGYPVRRTNFALSAALHALMVLAVGAGLVMVKNTLPRVDQQTDVSVTLLPYSPPIGTTPCHGGGSGGAAEKTLASKGVAPPSAQEQLTPPILLPNRSSKLVASAAVIAPPEMALPRTRQIGDPLSDLAQPSNGPGVGGGMGGEAGGGVGTKNGYGRGNGSDRGCCEDEYTVGNGVSMPRAIYAPEPEFSEEARRVKQQGEITLLATIGVDGRPRNLIVERSLGMGLDEKALETVRTWRFEPAKKDGHPVAVRMNIIVNFRLY